MVKAKDLKGKVAVVTGGTRGLGLRITEALVAEGAQVVAAARGAEGAAESLGHLGDRAVFQQADVRDAESVRSLLSVTADRFGGVDIVVANAGLSRPGPVTGLSFEHWSEALDTNLNGVFHCVREAVPYLERSDNGRIITLSSALGSRPTRGAASYCSTKAAVEMFTRVVALELAPLGITVNCLSPGFIDEGMGKLLKENEVVWGQYAPKVSLGRMGLGEEVADAAVYLASAAGSYVNGHVLEVNGGLSW
ncbi:SDR family NAD(P)-dependent oxidoreductase [Streptomyces scabiei]|uniref:SDR family NAD(P)-dependent oxidoreductase n=1 Tax=Streptomyces scabiei TaxID=1930 RepID=UPI00298F9C3A|nr:SDR family NAD(P)-dependent oxidoreductase [Streptomyces scabiei]MDW8805240.1 SDR family NAD(P)-dependent oxidoreductase [Streptomyces scabiei]